MALTPVVYRIQDLNPGTFTESSGLFASQLEEIPYPLGETEEANAEGTWPPAGFRETGMSTATTESVSSLSLLPQGFDLAWVQGDTMTAQFLFTDVLWTLDDPGVEEPLYNNVPVAVSTAALTSGVATLTTDSDHGFSVGFSVTVSGVGDPYDGVFTVLTVPSATSFTYAPPPEVDEDLVEIPFDDIASAAVDGEVSITNMPVWVATEWAAQVRNPYLYSTYATDYWVPANGYQYNWWRGHSVVAEFHCGAAVQIVPGSDPIQWGTMVTLTLPSDRSMLVLPGNWYRWDLQSRTIENEVRTHLRGRVNVVTEWTVR
jgi:hypothetical protein